MEWKKVVAGENDFVQIPERWLLLHYYEALNILFRIENSMRVFVYVILKNEFLDKWPTVNVPMDGGQQSTIETIAKRRRGQSDNFGYLGFPISCPIMHLTSGELNAIIAADAYWKHFSPHFSASKEVIKTKLEEIGIVRNSLAHFRPIKEDDVDVIKQNAKHALMAIEKCLFSIYNLQDVVPTNTEEEWYKTLSTVGTEGCFLKFLQSNDEKWVRVNVHYKCEILRKDSSGSFCRFSVPKVISPAILGRFPELTKPLTCLSEQVPYTYIDDKLKPDIWKVLSFVFRRDVLQSNQEAITRNVNDLISLLNKETELIKQDNLARGEIVETASVLAMKRKTGETFSWNIYLGVLDCDVRENDPAEYWGPVGYSNWDFIAGTQKYPWMPTSVSKPEPPF